MSLSPRESGHFISSNSDHIKINEDGVKSCSQEILSRLKSGQISIEALYKKTELHPQVADEKVIILIRIIHGAL